MDILAQNIQTGELKSLPPKVFEANKNKWRRVAQKEVKQAESDNDEDGLLPPVITKKVDVKPTTEEQQSEEPSKESLQEEYEKLSGEKPDGRWSEKKLAQKIEELKDNK